MGNTELMTYRRQLLALQSLLNTDVSDLADEAPGEPGDQASFNLSYLPIHIADQATDSFEQQFTLSLIENPEETLGKIAAALALSKGLSALFGKRTAHPDAKRHLRSK